MSQRQRLFAALLVLLIGGVSFWHFNTLFFTVPSGVLISHPGSIYRGPDAEDKVVVMARVQTEDVTWVKEELFDWQHAIYHMDDLEDGLLHPPKNRGREAMAYLTFLIDHYDKLPSTMVFVHPHREGWPRAWHTDAPNYDNALAIQSLSLDYVQQHGYVNMRCIHNPGCPDGVQPFRTEDQGTHEYAMREAWLYMFGGTEEDIPRIIAEPCCAQFAVSKTQVLQRPLSHYERYRSWLLNTTLDDATSGRVMEYLWHVFFGKPNVYCPDLQQCWCEQYGRC